MVTDIRRDYLLLFSCELYTGAKLFIIYGLVLRGACYHVSDFYAWVIVWNS